MSPLGIGETLTMFVKIFARMKQSGGSETSGGHFAILLTLQILSFKRRFYNK